MKLKNSWIRYRWDIYAPLYSFVVKPFEKGRKRAIERLDLNSDDDILILGCGIGNDLNHLTEDVSITAIDTSPSMIKRTEKRGENLNIDIDTYICDAQNLPLKDNKFDAVLLHLILSVVPKPKKVMKETERVLNQKGRVSIYDKFINKGNKPSIFRRSINPISRLLFADLNRQLEPMIKNTNLELENKESFLGGIYKVTIANPKKPN